MGEPAAGYLAASNDLVRQLTPLIVAHQGMGTMTALLPPVGEQRRPLDVNFGGLTLGVTYERLEAPGLADGVINEAGDRPANRTVLPAGAIVIQLGPDEFLFGGIGVTVTFAVADPGESDHRHPRVRGRPLRLTGNGSTSAGSTATRPTRAATSGSSRAAFTLQRVKLYRYH